MTWLQSTLAVCLAPLIVTAAIARTDASLDDGALEARWQSFAQTASQTRPAQAFPYAHCFKRAAEARA